jgi:hypothetical protein
MVYTWLIASMVQESVELQILIEGSDLVIHAEAQDRPTPLLVLDHRHRHHFVM